MLSLKTAASIDDMRLLARQRLPRFAFDFIDGGAETETNLVKNQQALSDIELVPRYLAGASNPTLTTSLFGHSYAVPFGMAPVGFLNMAWPETDLAVARLAAQENMPHVISTASSTSLEKIAQQAQGNAWFQIYISKSEQVMGQLLQRARDAGIKMLLVTVDVPQTGKRDRDIRNQLQIPFKLSPSILADLAMHPNWSIQSLRSGAPKMANFNPGDSPTAQSRSLVEVQEMMISQDFVWEDLQRLRAQWQGFLLLKGILHPADAERAIDLGCDGIVVSNHGGRQVDYGPASISALPAIARTVSGRVPIILDSGIRRGADIIRAKALGADFVLAGRAFAYGAAAGGAAGVNASFNILQTELSRALGQLGQHEFSRVDKSVLFEANTRTE